jgi:UDP-N-acetylmuramoyl-tripeptide--D-alanyl-D-alanine ligase
VGALGREFVEGARGAGLAASALHDFPDSEAAAREAVSLVQPGDAVLVKGSRGARMEKVVEALVSRFGEKAS